MLSVLPGDPAMKDVAIEAKARVDGAMASLK
jgi:hypothetical protein